MSIGRNVVVGVVGGFWGWYLGWVTRLVRFKGSWIVGGVFVLRFVVRFFLSWNVGFFFLVLVRFCGVRNVLIRLIVILGKVVNMI